MEHMEQMHVSDTFSPPHWGKEATRTEKLQDVIIYLANMAFEGDEQFFNPNCGAEDMTNRYFWYTLCALAYAAGRGIYYGDETGLTRDCYQKFGINCVDENDLVESLRDKLEE